MISHLSLSDSTFDYFYCIIGFLGFLYLLEIILDRYYFNEEPTNEPKRTNSEETLAETNETQNDETSKKEQ